MKTWIGVDISFKHFDAAFPTKDGSFKVTRFNQDETGFAEFVTKLDLTARVVIERTGGYSSKLLFHLYESQVEV